MRLRDLAVFLALAGLSGCNKEAPKDAPASKTEHEDHKAPHGGGILELGEEEAHLEVVHDPKGGVFTVYVYGKDLKTPVAVSAPTIVLSTGGGQKEFTPSPVDAKAGQSTATTWKLTDPALAVDPLDGRIRITINGKTHQSPLEPAGGH